MKSRNAFRVCGICLVSLLVLIGCATMRVPQRMTYERICGTWANEGYVPVSGEAKPPAKIIINPDGTYLVYQHVDQAGPTGAGFYTVEKRWTDEKGYTWYHFKIFIPLIDSIKYELSRVDRFNSVWELNQSNIDYPETVDPKDKYSNYRIYYRY